MPEEWTFLGLQDNSLAVHIHDTYAPELEIVGPRSPLPNKYGGFKGNSKHPKLGSGRLYPHGAVQPGAIFIHKETSVLVYRWTVDSNPANLGGAMGRPQWRPTMKVIASNLKRIEAGEEGVELLEVSEVKTVRTEATIYATLTQERPSSRGTARMQAARYRTRGLRSNSL